MPSNVCLPAHPHLHTRRWLKVETHQLWLCSPLSTFIRIMSKLSLWYGAESPHSPPARGTPLTPHGSRILPVCMLAQPSAGTVRCP
jgi:hypothetical protein